MTAEDWIAAKSCINFTKSRFEKNTYYCYRNYSFICNCEHYVDKEKHEKRKKKLKRILK